MIKQISALILALLVCSNIWAQDEEQAENFQLSDSMLAAFMAMSAEFDSIDNSFTYQEGAVEISNGLARLNLPEGYRYLNPEQAEYVLTQLWGNPPGSGSLGLIFPTGGSPMDNDSWAIDISYEETGHVEDDDAEDIDYADLLKEMRKDSKAYNKQRMEAGFDPIELIGWASPPFYDKANKKLHWAKELKFGEAEDHILNYNIRILGRKGVMVLNVIGDMSHLDNIKENIDVVLGSVSFNEGNRYSDFDSNIDEIAAVGIGGLIAGKVMAKAGIFALLAKGGKFILLAIVAAGAGIWRFISGKKAAKE